MDAFPANAIEDPFLGPGEQDPATQGHRGSSPQRANVFNISLFDAIDRDGRVPVHAQGEDQPGATGAGEGDDDDLPPSPPPSSPTTPTPVNDYSGSFTESTAATTLVSLGAGWSSPSPASSSQFATFQQLQTTICPEAVRPRTFSAAPALLVPSLSFPMIAAQELLASPPPPYPSASTSDARLGSNSLVMPTHTSFDVPTHADVFGPELAYEAVWHANSQPSSFYSDVPVSQEVEHTGGTRDSTWSFDHYRSRTRNIHTNRRRRLSTDSVASSATWTTAPVTPELNHPPMSRVASTSDLPRSPAVAVPEPKLEVALDSEDDAPHEFEEDLQEYEYDIKADEFKRDEFKRDDLKEEDPREEPAKDEMPLTMDSPTEVYHQLTDPIDMDAAESTQIATDDDDDYVDKDDEKDEEWSRPPVRQAQNHRRTFKVALWDTINDPAFSDLIHWSDDGLSGVIPDKNKFQTSKAMRAITDARDFGGFVRQLHMWGFKRFKVADYGDRSCGFSHIRFKRNRLDLLEDMTRKGETKPVRPTTRKRKNGPRARRKQSATPSTTASATGSDTTAKPKRAPRPRKASAKAKQEDGDNAPIDNLDSASSSPPPRDLRSKRSALASSSNLHRQSAERDTPIPSPRKRAKTSAQDAGAEGSLAPISTASQSSASSKKAGASTVPNRPAPTPDPSFPAKPAKSAKTRAKTSRA